MANFLFFIWLITFFGAWFLMLECDSDGCFIPLFVYPIVSAALGWLICLGFVILVIIKIIKSEL